MTPDERAEKILHMCIKPAKYLNDKVAIGLIAAEIRAAEDESHADCCLKQRARAEDYGYTKAWDEADKKIAVAVEEAYARALESFRSEGIPIAISQGKAEAYEEVLKSDSYRMNIWNAAQVSAYEDAAKIAEANAKCPTHCACGNEIAGDIRARAKEVSGDDGCDGVELSGL